MVSLSERAHRCGTYAIFSVFLKVVERLPVIKELGAEAFDTFVGLLLLGLYELLLGRFRVVVYGSGEGG